MDLLGLARRRGAGSGDGVSVWLHLVVLVLVPLVATGGLGAVVVDARVRDVHRHERAEELLRASAALDEVRRAVDQELMPALTVSVLREDDRAASLGVRGATRERLLAAERMQLRTARDATDLAVREARRTPRTAEALTALERGLRSARWAADAPSTAPEALTLHHLAVSDRLVQAERTTASSAASLGVDGRTARAVEDVRQVVEMTSAAGRELPLLFAATASSGEDRAALLSAFRAAGGTVDRTGRASGAFSDPELRGSALEVATSGVAAALSQRLADPSALVTGSPGALLPQEVLDLAAPGAQRDAVLSELLDGAVERATTASREARLRSQGQLRAALLLVAGVVVVALGTAAWVGRDLGGHLRQLLVAADATREGRPVQLPARAPREVRRVAAELSHTADVLRGVRQQIEAVARGDLSTALTAPAAPGHLGEAVQASVEAMVATLVANEALRAELTVQASTDGLTGLPNRGALLVALDQARDRQEALGGEVAVLFVDLDGFKAVNDTHGHATGDALLRAVARRMLGEVRRDDVVGRLGGDEFVVVAEGLDAQGACELGELLVKAVGRSFSLAVDAADPVSVEVGASIGVAAVAGSTGGPPVDGAVLLAAADAAVYRAKAAGRGCVVLVPGAEVGCARRSAAAPASAARSGGAD